MHTKLIERAAYRKMRWKNGLGVSEEIAVASAPGAVGFSWRLSFAQVAAGGPFSHYPDFDRILVVWRGDGLSLERGGEVVELPPLKPLRFSGNEVIESRLNAGPIEDFNVIYDPKVIRVDCQVVHVESETWLPPTAGQRFVVCVRGELTCDDAKVQTGDTWWSPVATEVRLVAAGECIVIDVRIQGAV